MVPSHPRRMFGSVAAFVAVACLLAASASAQTTASEAAATLELVPEGSALVRDGAVLYDHNCSACHGDTGGGMSEAVTSFPEEKRSCTQCHKPSNPSQMDHLAMNWRNAFDVGVAPPVIGEDALEGFGTGAALFGYLRATMPRPWPGLLDDDTYLAITAFLAAANGAEGAGAIDAIEQLTDLRLP